MTRPSAAGHATLVLLAAALLPAAPAPAQTARSGGDSQRATQQLQQLASERTAAQAEAAKAKQALADAQKQVTLLTAERDALRAKANGIQATVASAEGKERAAADELAQTKSKLSELVGKFRETATTLREVEAGRAQAHNELATLGRDYQACVEHNAELGQLALDAVERYARVGGVARSEPFTRIARSRAENLADEYRAKVDDLRVRRSSAAAARPEAGDATPR